MRRNGVFIAALTLVVAAGVWWRFRGHAHRPPPPPKKLNFLIISLCSMRYQNLAFYGGPHPASMPATNSFFSESSFAFTNAVNPLPWTGIRSYIERLFSRSDFERMGYHFFGRHRQFDLVRIPTRHSLTYPKDTLHDDNDFEKNYKSDLNRLKQEVLNPTSEPFFIVAHFKYLHYPLIDRFNANSGWDRELNAAEKERLKQYVEHPEKFPEKIPFLLLLTDNPKALSRLPELRRQLESDNGSTQEKYLGLITNPKLLKRWQTSRDFAEDVVILKKIYLANLHYLDHVLAPLFTLFGDKHLQKNTVVMLIGDHGEMQMEHGLLTHGISVFEDSIRVPVAIRFPGHRGQTQPIADQIDFPALAELIGGIMKGKVTESNFRARFESHKPRLIAARDCALRWRGLRVENRYKYMVRVSDGRRFLYDLKEDPGELHDIANLHPDLTNQFETEYWKALDRLKGAKTGNCPGIEGEAARVRRHR